MLTTFLVVVLVSCLTWAVLTSALDAHDRHLTRRRAAVAAKSSPGKPCSLCPPGPCVFPLYCRLDER